MQRSSSRIHHCLCPRSPHRKRRPTKHSGQLLGYTHTLGTLTIAPVTVGQGLETPITVNISPAPSSALMVTIVSSDPSKMLLAGRVGDPGTPSIVAVIGPGITSIGGIYVQGLVSSG